jgi:hypothetical protein
MSFYSKKIIEETLINLIKYINTVYYNYEIFLNIINFKIANKKFCKKIKSYIKSNNFNIELFLVKRYKLLFFKN